MKDQSGLCSVELASAELGYSRILVPIAMSASCQASLAFAQRLSRETKAQLLLLHAVQLNIAGEERGIPRIRLLKQCLNKAELELGRLAQTLDESIESEIVVQAGRPATVILETAKQRCVDAIVICTHGVRGWLRWLHRNTAEEVARSASCAVWLVSPGRSENSLNLTVVDRAPVLVGT